MALARAQSPVSRSDGPFEASHMAARTWPGVSIIAATLEKAAISGGSGAPVLPKFVRRTLVDAVVAAAKRSFLDRNQAASATQPASVNRGGIEIVSSGSNSPAMATDMPCMVDAITTRGTAVCIMRRKTFAYNLSANKVLVTPPNALLLGIGCRSPTPCRPETRKPTRPSLIDAIGVIVRDCKLDVQASDNANSRIERHAERLEYDTERRQVGIALRNEHRCAAGHARVELDPRRAVAVHT
jgi:hypothetical protein